MAQGRCAHRRDAGAATAPALPCHGLPGGDAPQIVGGLAVTRDGFPVRHGVFPGNTVDVTTVAQVKEDLRGWQLTRCLFVGEAGMVSHANLQTLAQGGGKYLLAMPMRRGDEVTEAVLSPHSCPYCYRGTVPVAGATIEHACQDTWRKVTRWATLQVADCT